MPRQYIAAFRVIFDLTGADHPGAVEGAVKPANTAE